MKIERKKHTKGAGSLLRWTSKSIVSLNFMKKLCFTIIALCSSMLSAEVYDCFPFWKEFEVLKIRLEELYDEVDHFVIVEATKTFTGLPKPLYFAENAHLYEKYKDKIIHVVVDDFPVEGNPEKDFWIREVYQHNAVIRGLAGCNPDDIIFLSDLDEIPRCTTMQNIKHYFASKPSKKYRDQKKHKKTNDIKANMVTLDMPNFSCQLNRTAETRWIGPAKAVPYWVLSVLSVDDIHLFHHKHSDLFVMQNAGWHFNTMGDWKAAIDKWLCHNVDFANSGIIDEEALKKNYNDFLLRHKPIPVDESFPKLVRENLNYYKSIGWIADH